MQTVSAYVTELLASPEPVLTEAGRAALAQAVLAIKLAAGQDAAGQGQVAARTFRKFIPARPASQSNAFRCEVA